MEAHTATINETQVERKASRLGPVDALAIARDSAHVYAAKGKKIIHFDMSEDHTDEALLAHLIGRSGFLRAPAMRIGDRFVVGYNAELFTQLMG